MLAIGNPIFGDSIYFLEDLLLKRKGLYLQEHSLGFVHPIFEEKMLVTALNSKKFMKLFPSYISEVKVTK